MSTRSPIIEIQTGRQILNSLLQSQVHKVPQELSPIVGALPDENWCKWVSAHGLSSLFLFACQDKDLIPETVRPGWERLHLLLMFKNIGFLKTADKLFADLEDAGIQAVAMRGLTLLNKMYADPGMRVMGDVDILIDPSDKEELKQALAERDYRLKAVHRTQYVYKVDQFNMEIHWFFISAKRYREQMDTRQFIGTRQPLTVKEGTIFCLTPENELIGLVSHAVIHHELTMLRQLFDIALYLSLSDMDWDLIATWCRNTRMTRMFLFTIQLTGTLFELDVSDILSHFDSRLPRSWGKMVDKYIESFFTTRISQLFARKRNSIYMAQGILKKAEQLVTMFSMSEATDIYKRYFESADKGN